MGLAELKPSRSSRLIDLVEQAQFDVSDWGNYRKGPRYASQNPKFCYEWSFVDGDKVLLSLWHDNFSTDGDTIVHRRNFRVDAQQMAHNPKWRSSAPKLDRAVSYAWRNALPVRVIINAGAMRDNADPDAPASSVKLRALDPEPWVVSLYDEGTGDHILTRGARLPTYVDQHTLAPARSAANDQMRVVTERVRDRRVRDAALTRASGRCQLCNTPGFEMASGAIYLETHHVVPLSEGGADDLSNLVALCPTDHRRAHYAVERNDIRAKLIEIAGRAPAWHGSV